MNYLLDTCLLSELHKTDPNQGVTDWVRNTNENRFLVSALSLGEIQKGIAKLEDGRRKRAIQSWLDHDLRERFAGRILPVDEDVALEWGMFCGASERKGLSLPAIDSLLAVSCVVHNLVIVTRNDKDFECYPIKRVNPWSN